MQKTGILIGLLGLLAASAVFLWPAPPAAGQDRPAGTGPTAADQAQAGPVYLYFVDPATGYLTGEARGIERGASAAAYCARLVNALIAGPRTDLMRTLPEQTRLRAVYPTDAGIVYVDLSADVARKHPGGVRSELLSVYSIVNTLVLNTDGIRAVRILVNGKASETLAGHIDIRLPINAQMLLVR